MKNNDSKFNQKPVPLIAVPLIDMYDFGARLFDVAGVPMWTSVDPLAEKYYNITPYSYCAGNPVMFIDPTGMDYWSTSDPEEIYTFLKTLQSKDFTEYKTNRKKWKHTKDADFLANLTYNDKTDKYWYSYCTVEDGEVVCNAVSFNGSYQESFSDSFLAWFEDANTVSERSGKSLKNYAGNSTVGTNGKFYWHADDERGFYGNQYVSTKNLAKLGSGVAKVTGLLGLGFSGYEILEGYKLDGGFGYNFVKASAKAVGEHTGGWAGAAVGAKFGLIVSGWTGFGSIPCTIICAAIGGLAGSKAFGRGGTGIVDAAYGR